jgi:hypothetical protein
MLHSALAQPVDKKMYIAFISTFIGNLILYFSLDKKGNYDL